MAPFGRQYLIDGNDIYTTGVTRLLYKINENLGRRRIYEVCKLSNETGNIAPILSNTAKTGLGRATHRIVNYVQFRIAFEVILNCTHEI
ncbi:hypothetical protein NQ318_015025 [Aromia moschata]|uniref:Uncharacterized protein n=1 Tax=Aromia moschata TaxID=1265417 RepID=A0AAV8YXF7_9CUCU|nr:hypothetical protein NQ318_015025 [Aromia moschata]